MLAYSHSHSHIHIVAIIVAIIYCYYYNCHINFRHFQLLRCHLSIGPGAAVELRAAVRVPRHAAGAPAVRAAATVRCLEGGGAPLRWVGGLVGQGWLMLVNKLTNLGISLH